MTKEICSVYDKKTGLYDQPLCVRHVGEAIREWSIVKEDKQTKFGRNPEDFDLYHIASYNEQTAQFENHVPPRHLDSGV